MFVPKFSYPHYNCKVNVVIEPENIVIKWHTHTHIYVEKKKKKSLCWKDITIFFLRIYTKTYKWEKVGVEQGRKKKKKTLPPF